ncbi:insulin-like receptor [Diorhabda sublineata]|uniref:insulin-like receptor n=1 Tax=Diorhabda sublineata TaxID=1163346 RepID=UPI0024E1288E|nr:insulin-like receptor [Diorhabda sublineata]XP_056645514.1 insulin-like receptor [Diorhabda sublineata]XP_056645515.1 insulin-like receptor [Diorhabda sublineata]
MAVDGIACSAHFRQLFGSGFPTKTILIYVCILLAGFLHLIAADDIETSLLSDSINENDSKRICSSMDIRNSLESFKKLENCEVIEGFLSILLFDNVNETEMSKISFPLLTEITDYLLLYRVNGLRSVGQLFPNLTVIRGQSTFLDHSFVIFEMSTLQEIGLHSLTDIIHGQVHIDKNPSLCFVHTIDWDSIVKDKSSKNFIKSLKPENECPVCPSTVVNGNTTMSCPTVTDADGKERYLCWNKNHCQKKCPGKCRSCNNNLQCCDESCLACSDENPNICTVCPHISYGHGSQKSCRTSCPKDLYSYLNRRCIDKQQCLNLHNPIELQTTNYYPEPYKIHENSCVLVCPPDYTEKNSTCVHCGGRCKQTCPGLTIDSIAVSTQLRGCTHIDGSLEIQLRGGANITELEENLKMIEEISGYLKVVRSFPLLSLNFFKNLKRILGKEKDSGKYVLSVLDNQNLQDLWDWSTHGPIEIQSGKLFFHFNPKLCYDKILKLQEIAGLANFTDLEVAKNSNGDKTACNISTLIVNVTNIRSNSSTLQWESFYLDDPRKLLAYIVYYVEAPYDNVTQYDGKDACGQDNWRVLDIPNKEGDTNITFVIRDLKPFTRYAFYVKTYTIANERNGAQSSIQYFRTLPAMPMQPGYLGVISNSSDSLIITWDPPSVPNGPITHYIVTGKRHYDVNYSKDHNYCNDNTPKEEVHSTPKPPVQYNCQCESSSQNNINFDENEEGERIKFEDDLINQVYLKRPKRSVLYTNSTIQESQNFTQKQMNNSDIVFYYKTVNTSIYVTNLTHYTKYEVNVRACRDDECSVPAKKTERTKDKAGADQIRNLTLIEKHQDSVKLSWIQPTDPNGNIFAYIVEYKRLDIDNAKAIPECLNVTDKNTTFYYTVSKLIPGNYSLCVYARSATRKEQSMHIFFHIKEPSSNTALIVSTMLSIFFVCILLFGLWMYRKSQKKPVATRDINPEYGVHPYVMDEWEVSRDQIIVDKELGQGSFGMVWDGIAKDIRGAAEVRCAVKTVPLHATERERLEFLNEASVMKAFDTTHVVRLLGVVSEGQPTLVIMELMANGDLKSYLRSHRPDMENYNPNHNKHPPTLKQILQMAIEIADGMAYLSAKKFVHRDLAARNCMVSENLVVKIGDFGMTRDIYETDYYRKGTKGLLPVRWMAPESLKDGVFTSSSDVWSYGVVLWEMATLASQPYQGLANDQVLRYVIDGGVMERPENCPDKLYTLMRYCWQHKPSSRPTFLKLCSLLLEDASPTFADVSFYHSPAGVEARASRHTPSPSQDDQTTPLRTVAERLKGYMPSHSQDSDDLDIDTHHQFPSITESGGVITTANGYVSGCPTNGAATTQC